MSCKSGKTTLSQFVVSRYRDIAFWPKARLLMLSLQKKGQLFKRTGWKTLKKTK